MSAATAFHKTCPQCGLALDRDAAFCPVDGSSLIAAPVDPYIGMVIGGDIELQSVAGAGAMGRVYRAHQRGTERDVAVKILLQELCARPQLVARFNREAKIASKLRHPHVVDVYLTGAMPDGALFIAMEFLEGVTLAQALEACGAMQLDRALAIMLAVSEAVGEGHQMAIVHRDLKTENVMLIRRGDNPEWVKVLDFGIAHASLAAGSMETASGAVLGTARYISPEGAQGMQVTPASDVYSLAVILYQLLAGEPPFDAEQAVGLLIKHVHEAPRPLRSWSRAAHVPAAIEAVILAALSKDPAARPQTGRAFAAALRQAQVSASGSHAQHVIGPRNTPEALPVIAFGPTGSMQPVSAQVPASYTNPNPNASSHGFASISANASAPNGTPSVLPPHAEPQPVLAAKSSRGWMIAPAFVIGGLLTAGVLYTLQPKVDKARLLALSRAGTALNEAHFATPPGENVKELVGAALLKWPKDPEFLRIRDDAGRQLVAMGMAARVSGDLVGARTLLQQANELIPMDNASRYMRAQAEDEFQGVVSGATVNLGAPRLIFESPAVAKPGERVEMTCRIVPGAGGAKAKIASVRMSVYPNGTTTNGTPVELNWVDATHVRAVLTAGPAMSYDVAFEANVDNTSIRAMRDLDVVR